MDRIVSANPANMAHDGPLLPPLRRDLSLIRAEDDADQTGSKSAARYLIHDPVAGRFHRISETMAGWLNEWRAIPPAAFIARIAAQNPQLSRADVEPQVKALIGFLDRNRLLDGGGSGNAQQLSGLEARRRRPWHEIILHKYLYIRLPLFRPTAFLDRLLPWLEPWFRPAAAWGIAGLGATGLYLAARQWQDFTSTFAHFFSPGGMVFYALTLLVIKSLHELGHAVAARRAGTAVPIIGVAFLVLFPILYTDTTDAWRLKDRRERVLIDAGGMIVELIIACLAIFLWSVLPDGPLRSAAFFAATTSWTMSLLVNLNPCMRFDGYYLLSDLMGIENLQARGFAMGRWQMRRTLLGLTASKPKERRGHLLCAYAYFTWIYRFFLFIGIALLIHHLLPKAIGIPLFCLEIGIFIMRPILNELKQWWSLRMTILTQSRGRITLLVMGASLGTLFVPWQTRVTVPALIQSAEQVQIFGQADAYVKDVLVRSGQNVAAGQPLIQLRSPAVDHEITLARHSLTLAEAEYAKHAADRHERQGSALREDQLIAAQSRLDTLSRQAETLIIRAPISGSVMITHTALETGLQTSAAQALMRIDGAGTALFALAKDSDHARITAGLPVRFISDTMGAPVRRFQISRIAETASPAIDTPLLTMVQGGTLAVTKDASGQLIPDIPVFALSAASSEAAHGTQRGVAVITAARQAPITPIRRRIAGLLIRETDF